MQKRRRLLILCPAQPFPAFSWRQIAAFTVDGSRERGANQGSVGITSFGLYRAFELGIVGPATVSSPLFFLKRRVNTRAASRESSMAGILPIIQLRVTTATATATATGSKLLHPARSIRARKMGRAQNRINPFSQAPSGFPIKPSNRTLAKGTTHKGPITHWMEHRGVTRVGHAGTCPWRTLSTISKVPTRRISSPLSPLVDGPWNPPG